MRPGMLRRPGARRGAARRGAAGAAGAFGGLFGGTERPQGPGAAFSPLVQEVRAARAAPGRGPQARPCPRA